MIPDPLDAVIFDMDGLLLDSERLYRDAMRAACVDRGLVLRDDLFRQFVGSSWPACTAMLAAEFGAHFPGDDYRREALAHYDRLAEGGTPLRPGVIEILDHLRRGGIPRAVATSTATARARAKLDRTGLLDLFDTLVGADDVARHKPFPDPYLLAAERLGVQPAHCLALEDSPTGVRAAAAAGMATIMVPDLVSPTAETEALCVATLPSLADVLELLARR